MRTITHREMRNNSAAVLRAVADGESVQVTNNGQVAAVISPPAADLLAELASRGSVRPARRPLSDLLIIRRREASKSSAEILQDSRGRW